MRPSFRPICAIGTLCLIWGALAVPQAEGKPVAPVQVPVARLLKNMAEYVKAHPKDAEGYYILGRVNSTAFARDTETVSVYREDEIPPRFPYYTSIITPRTEKKPLSGPVLTYLTDALRNYLKATELDPRKAIAFLGLGFECEETLRFPETLPKAWEALALPRKADAEILHQYALDAYRKAYKLSIDADLKSGGRLDRAISEEAAEGIFRLQKGRMLTEKEEAERKTLEADLGKLRSQPRAMSPILISFQGSTHLSDLLAPGSQVRFDLAGIGKQETWPWIKPTTGLLVWDPAQTGKITSGLQLFGNVTWWMFWKDGYAPLDALDNDRNGWLIGKELEGLYVWFDRNGNGVSDPGEVVSLASLGIRRIAVHSDGTCEGVPAHRQGVQFTDGSYAATFDWTPTALSTAPGARRSAPTGK